MIIAFSSDIKPAVSRVSFREAHERDMLTFIEVEELSALIDDDVTELERLETVQDNINHCLDLIEDGRFDDVVANFVDGGDKQLCQLLDVEELPKRDECIEFEGTITSMLKGAATHGWDVIVKMIKKIMAMIKEMLTKMFTLMRDYSKNVNEEKRRLDKIEDAVGFERRTNLSTELWSRDIVGYSETLKDHVSEINKMLSQGISPTREKPTMKLTTHNLELSKKIGEIESVLDSMKKKSSVVLRQAGILDKDNAMDLISNTQIALDTFEGMKETVKTLYSELKDMRVEAMEYVKQNADPNIAKKDMKKDINEAFSAYTTMAARSSRLMNLEGRRVQEFVRQVFETTEKIQQA